MCLNFVMFDWPGKNGDKSGGNQGILISCVRGNPGYHLGQTLMASSIKANVM